MPEERIKEIFDNIVCVVVDAKLYGVVNQSNFIVLFPPDLMRYGLGSEIHIEVSNLNAKDIRETRSRLHNYLVECLRYFFPDAHVQCDVP